MTIPMNSGSDVLSSLHYHDRGCLRERPDGSVYCNREEAPVVRRITITERPGYEPDGDGFVRRVSPHEALFGFALAVNKREQERKAMNCKHGITQSDCGYCDDERKDASDGKNFSSPQPNRCKHGATADVDCGACAMQLAVDREEQKAKKEKSDREKMPWAPPETLSAKLSRFLFQIQNTETSLAELRREVEKLRASL